MEEQKQQAMQKAVVIPRAVTIEEMMNIISDKLDYLIAQSQERK